MDRIINLQCYFCGGDIKHFQAEDPYRSVSWYRCERCKRIMDVELYFHEIKGR